MKAIEEVDTIFNKRTLFPPSEFAILTHSLGRREVFILYFREPTIDYVSQLIYIIHYLISSMESTTKDCISGFRTLFYEVQSA